MKRMHCAWAQILVKHPPHPDDEIELLYLFEGIRDERYDTWGSFIMSPAYNSTWDVTLAGIAVKLVKYCDHQMLRRMESFDAIQFDLLDFLWKNERKYYCISTIVKDLLNLWLAL